MSVRRKQNKAVHASPAPCTSSGAEMILVPATKLRGMIGISAVTLWRWRQNEASGFPRATTINGRNYFSWNDVQAWLARQQQAA